MKRIILSALILVSTLASAEGQIASLVSFESTALRPDSDGETNNITSIVNTTIEYTMPSNISAYGGFSFVLGESFESSINMGARYYSSAPALQIIPGAPMWTYIGGGVSFFDGTVYYPEAGFRIATSDSSRLDVYVKILNSSDEVYDKHVMIGAGLTF